MENSIDKEFVPFELAVKLKELGFNEKCLGCYVYITHNLKWEIRYNISNNDMPHLIASPLWQQAFEWFREKYKLHSCIAPIYENEKLEKIIYCYWIQGVGSNDEDEINYTDYNEARAACLEKLIEIAKSK